jgi:hypothetical protein
MREASVKADFLELSRQGSRQLLMSCERQRQIMTEAGRSYGTPRAIIKKHPPPKNAVVIGREKAENRSLLLGQQPPPFARV